MQAADTVEVLTGESPTGSVIWLHGLGADGHDFEPIVPELRFPADLALRFVFPHAPVRPVTINGGMAMRAWYDILSLDSTGRADRAGVLESSDLLERLIAREVERGIPPDRIVVAGFSQGGAIAIHTALQTGYSWRTAVLIPCCEWSGDVPRPRSSRRVAIPSNGVNTRWRTPSARRKLPISVPGWHGFMPDSLR